MVNAFTNDGTPLLFSRRGCIKPAPAGFILGWLMARMANMDGKNVLPYFFIYAFRSTITLHRSKKINVN